MLRFSKHHKDFKKVLYSVAFRIGFYGGIKINLTNIVDLIYFQYIKKFSFKIKHVFSLEWMRLNS